MQSWNILLVDDEPDVHEVTRLALKHRRWRKRPFELTSLMSMRDAIALFETQKPSFQVAIVDVVWDKRVWGFAIWDSSGSICPDSFGSTFVPASPGEHS